MNIYYVVYEPSSTNEFSLRVILQMNKLTHADKLSENSPFRSGDINFRQN